MGWKVGDDTGMRTGNGLAVRIASAVIGLGVLVAGRPALAVGEAQNGFPNWSERVLHQWMNRARVDPATELASCPGTNCPDKACYTATTPLYWNLKLGRAARYHSDEMQKQGYAGLDHNSECTIVSNIDALYPGSCDGSAACGCVGGKRQCMTACQDFSQRVALFGNSTSGEIIAGGTNPNSAFYLWLYEAGTNATCAYSSDKGHRWNILKAGPSVGTGVSSGPLYGGTSVGDFGPGGTPHKIPSGSHYPQSGTSVEAWANWYDTAAPTQALVNVDGTCTPLTRKRGSDTNGAFSAMLSGLSATGCARYYFVFKDSTGAEVTYPTTGSLGIGPAASCPDFSTARPGACGCKPVCTGKVCGDDLCGGTCGTCASGSCQSGQCVMPQTDGDGGTGGNNDGGEVIPTDTLGGGCSCQLGSGAGPTGYGAGSGAAPAAALAGLLLSIMLVRSSARRRRVV